MSNVSPEAAPPPSVDRVLLLEAHARVLKALDAVDVAFQALLEVRGTGAVTGVLVQAASTLAGAEAMIVRRLVRRGGAL